MLTNKSLALNNRACNFKQLVSQSKFSWIRKITLEISVV